MFDSSSTAARCQRLHMLRAMTGLSRDDFSQRTGISRSTLQYWEDGRGNGLSEKGAIQIIAAYHQEGILCDLKWLMYGIGNTPSWCRGPSTAAEGSKETRNRSDEEKIAIEELLFFRKCHADVADFIINDDGMAPYYSPGHIVAGRKFYGDDIKKLLGRDCIIETTSSTYLRRLKSSNKKNLYTLQCTNLDSTLSETVAYDIELISAAEVIWHRRLPDKVTTLY